MNPMQSFREWILRDWDHFMHWLIVSSIVILLGIGIGAATRHHRSLPVAYSAWCKMQGTTNISFEEWMALRNADALPGVIR